MGRPASLCDNPPFKLNVDVTCGVVIFANLMHKILHQIGAALYISEAVIIDTTLETDPNTNLPEGHLQNIVLEFLSVHQQLKDHSKNWSHLSNVFVLFL